MTKMRFRPRVAGQGSALVYSRVSICPQATVRSTAREIEVLGCVAAHPLGTHRYPTVPPVVIAIIASLDRQPVPILVNTTLGIGSLILGHAHPLVDN